jgi:branched-chain amino acid transport system ATP-binding protein
VSITVAPSSEVLRVSEVYASYGSGPLVLGGVSLEVHPGHLTLLIGPNGAGKSTVLRTISGLTTLRRGTVQLGDIAVGGLAPEQIARAGVAHVLQGRTTIPFLTVEENLRLGGYGASREETGEDVERVLSWIPRLRDFLPRLGGTLSGGQQQLVELGRALVRRPRLVMIDEPSLGLAPQAAADVLLLIRAIADEGIAVLMVEQRVRDAFQYADEVAVLHQGQVALGPSPRESLSFEQVRRIYMGSES